MRYHFKIHKERSGGFWAECVELKGCLTQAETREQLEKNMTEALNIHLDEPMGSKTVQPLPKRKVKGRNIVEVKVEFRIAFAFALRRARLKHRMTQRQAAEKIGITGSLNNYQRLESSATANPELATLVQIKKAFPEFPLDQVAS